MSNSIMTNIPMDFLSGSQKILDILNLAVELDGFYVALLFDFTEAFDSMKVENSAWFLKYRIPSPSFLIRNSSCIFRGVTVN
jgi:hypothetical protein